MKLWLVRHAESTANAGARSETPERPPLTRRGHKQAEAVAEHLTKLVPSPDRVVISTFLRTEQTARPYLRRHNPLLPEVWPVHEWIFLNPANYVGTTHQERVKDVEAFADREDPFYCDDAKGESLVSFMERVDECLNMGRRSDRCNTVIFTHGRFIRGVLWRLKHRGDLAWGWELFRSFWAFSLRTEVDNCQIFALEYDGKWRLNAKEEASAEKA